MKHVVFGAKSLLTGAEAADLLARYGALVGKIGSADFVELDGVDQQGNDTTVGFLLNAGANLVVETAHSSLPEPDNATATAYMTEQLRKYEEFPVDYWLNQQSE